MATLVATGQITIIDTNDLPAVATAVGDGVTKRFLYRGPIVTINDSVSYRVLATPTHYSVVTGTPDVAVFVTAPEKGALLTGVSSLASTEKSHVYYELSTPTGGTYYTGDLFIDISTPELKVYRYNGVTWLTASGTDYLNTLYTDMADDNILSRVEKPRVYIDWEAAKAEKVTIDQRVSAYGVEASAFTTAYNALSSMMAGIDYSNMSTNSTIVGSTWRATWTTYYTTKADLLTRLSSASIPKIEGVITNTFSSLTVNANNGTTFTASAATFDGHGFVPGDKVMLTGQGTDDGIYTVAYTSTGDPASYINSSSVATSGPSESGTITLPSNAYNHAPNPANVATISATPLAISGTYYGIFSGLSGSATAGTIYTTFGVVTDSSTGSTLTVAVDYTINGTTWYPMGAGNSGTAGLYTDTVSPLTISAAVSGATLSSTAVRFTVMSRRHKSWNSDTSTFDFIYDSTEALVQSVYFYTTGTGNSSWSFINKKAVTDQSVWAVTYGTAYGTRKWIASVSSGGDITLLTDTGEVPTSGTGTVTSVTAGDGLTQTGTNTVNPVINIAPHSGTSGSIGTLYVSADAVGVSLGTSSGTTAYPGNNPLGFTSNAGTVTSVAALTLGTTGTDLSSSVSGGTAAAVITLNVPTASASNRGALSSTDWSTFNGKTSNLGTVTSVAALTLGTTGTDLSSSVSGGSTAATITLNVPTASASNRGALSSTDWSTFNGKQAALSAATSAQNGYMTSTYASKLDGIAANATNVTNTSQLINGAGYITNTGNTSGSAGSVANSLSAGSYLTWSAGTTFNGSAASTLAVDATSANTASKVVARDASNNFSAGTVTVNSLTVAKVGTDSLITFPAQTNDPAYIKHYESNNTAVMYFNVSDDANDNFHFGYTSSPSTFILRSDGVVTTGAWNGSSISTTYTDAKVTAVNAGTGIGVSATTGSLTVSNTGVLSVTAGGGISVSQTTGALTVTNSGITSVSGTSPISTSTVSGGVSVSISATVGVPVRFYYEAWVDVADKQPVYRVQKDSILKAIRWFRDDNTTVSGTTTLVVKKNNATLYTLVLSSTPAYRTWSTDWNSTDRSSLSDALSAGDYLELIVSSTNLTVMNLTVQLDITQAITT